MSTYYVRIGDLKQAVLYIPEDFHELKLILNQADMYLLDGGIDFEEPESCEALNKLIARIREFKRCDIYGAEKIFEVMVPKGLFILLKECYAKKQDYLNYNICLRETIRRCVQSEERKHWVKELKLHLEEVLSVDLLSSIEPRSEMDKIKNQVLENYISQLNHYSFNEIGQILREYIGTQDRINLTKAIKKLQDSLKPGFFNWLWDNKNEQQKNDIERITSVLIGINYFYEGEIVKSLHQFQITHEHRLMGLAALCDYRYRLAIKEFDLADAHDYVVRIMNEKDTDPLCPLHHSSREEQLGWVDAEQKKALQIILNHLFSTTR